MKRLSIPMTGAIIAVAYFLITTFTASLYSSDPEQVMVFAQMTNLPVTLLLALLSAVVPVNVLSSIAFQLVVGVILNFIIGWLVGFFVKKIVLKKRT